MLEVRNSVDSVEDAESMKLRKVRSESFPRVIEAACGTNNDMLLLASSKGAEA
jgi:hypothetical protein